jgi:hypothetical protein
MFQQDLMKFLRPMPSTTYDSRVTTSRFWKGICCAFSWKSIPQHLFFWLQSKLQLVISESDFSSLSYLVYLSHFVSKLLLKTYINWDKITMSQMLYTADFVWASCIGGLFWTSHFSNQNEFCPHQTQHVIYLPRIGERHRHWLEDKCQQTKLSFFYNFSVIHNMDSSECIQLAK